MRRLALAATLMLVAVLAASAAGVFSTGRSSPVAAGICAARGRLDALRLPSAPSRLWAADGEVDAVLPCGKTVFVGGSFDVIGPFTGSFASVSGTSGAADTRMPVLSEGVAALAADGRGGWLVGTDHTEYPGGCAALRRVRGDGSVAWRTSVCRASGSAVRAIARRGSTVFLGGLFTRVGGEPRSNAAAVDVATGRVLPWNPRVGGTPVYDRETLVPRLVTSVVVEGSRVYLGGFFDRVGSERLLDLAVVDAATAQPDRSLLVDFGGDPFAEVDAVALAGGTVYIGGRFHAVDGTRRTAAAALDRQSGRLLAWDPRLRGGGYTNVTSLVATSRGILVGGLFTSAWARGRSSVALVSATTGTPLPWAPRLSVAEDGRVEGLLNVAGGTVVAGEFLSVNGRRRPYAALVDPNGRLAAWAPGPAGAVRAAAYDGRRIALGGTFEGIGARPRGHLAALDARTGHVRAWQPRPDGPVGALAADERRLYVGGGFEQIGGGRRGRLAAFELPSLRLSPWQLDVAGQSVDALALAGSTLYLGGDFGRVGGEPRRALAAVDVASGRVLPLQASLVSDPRPFVYHLADQNGLLYLGGQFTAGSNGPDGFAVVDDHTGHPRWTIRLDPVGLSDSASIDAFALSGNRLFVLGDFAGVSGQPRPGAAALDSRSGDLLPWRLQLRSKDDMNFSVSAAAAASGDWVIVGGDFSRINGKPSHGVAAVSATSSQVAPWAPPLALGGFEASCVIAGETVYIFSYNDAALATFTPTPRS
jgi:hypothetical protein